MTRDASPPDRSALRPLSMHVLTVSVLMLAWLTLGACGGGGHAVSDTSSAPSEAVDANATPGPSGSGGFLASDADADRDDTGRAGFYLKPSRHDSFIAENEGPEIAGPERRAIAVLIKRYYAAGAAGDGAQGCSMLSSLLRAGLAEESSSTDRPSGATTCATVLSRFFGQQHQLLKAADVSRMVVLDVRARHGRATALLGFRLIPVGSIGLEREDHRWRIAELLHKALPS